MSKENMRVQAHSVAPIKLPTEFAELTPDLKVRKKKYTDCSSCENVGAPDSVLQALGDAISKTPSLIWDHWQPQDPNLRGKIAELHGVDVDQVFITAGAIAGIDYCFRVFTKQGTTTGLLRPDWPGFEHYVDFHRNEKRWLDGFEFPFVFDPDQISRFVQREKLDCLIMANPVASKRALD